jgi:3,4-dihydroxy 2-butanone 4-phosphate synthase/GTP cyclohydrolase II
MSFHLPLSAPRATEGSAEIAEGATTGQTIGNSLNERMLARLRGSGLAFLQPLVEHLAAHRSGTCERAFVTLSYSQSLDGSIAVSRSTPCSLSCPKSLEMTHRVRSLHDGLLVGINTILTDDPQLTVRYCEGDDPHPVVLDSHLRFPERARLLKHGSRKPIIITTRRAPADHLRRLEDKGARVFAVREHRGRVDLRAALRLLRSLDIRDVMVEGGATVINAMLALDLVDYCVLTITPRIIGGVKAVESLCRPDGAAPLSIDDCRYHTLDRDLIAYGRLSRG